jgi:hypothetical protein
MMAAKRILSEGFKRCNSGLRMDVAFKDMGYTLPPPLNKCILRDVSGCVKPGRVTAIMCVTGLTL